MENVSTFEHNHLERRLAELEAQEALWRKAEEEALRLNAMVQSASDAIIGKTTTGIVQTWNPGAERLYGYSAAEMLGRDMTIILPPNRCGSRKTRDEMQAWTIRCRLTPRTCVSAAVLNLVLLQLLICQSPLVQIGTQIRM
jgi:PAS domain-containing protein